MAITVEHYKAGWNDITDYVESCGVVPFNPVNRDYSLQAQTWDVVIACTIRTFYSDETFNFAASDKIRVYNGATLLFSGYVDKSVYTYGSMNFALKIKTSIMKLTNKKVQYDGLDTEFATGVNWYDYTAASYYYSMPIVGAMWALKCLFSVCGLTLDTSEIDDVKVLTRNESDGNWAGNVDVLYKYFYFYEDMVWCIGHNVAVGHANLDQNINHDENKLTCFELVSAICSYLRLAVRLVDVDSYKLISLTTNFDTSATGGDIDDVDKFEYSRETILASDERVSAGDTIFSEVNLQLFTANPLPDAEPSLLGGVNGAGSSVGALSLFCLFFSDAVNKATHYEEVHDYVKCQFDASTDFVINDGTVGATLNLTSITARAKLNNYLQEVVLTNIKTDEKTILQNNIDLVWSNSEISQETY